MTAFDRVRTLVRLVKQDRDISADVFSMGNDEFQARIFRGAELVDEWVVTVKPKRLTARTADRSRVVARLT